MEFQEWCDYHDGDYETAGMDKMCHFSEWTVGITPGAGGDDIVVVQKISNPERYDYRARESEVSFTQGGIQGNFKGNMSSRDNFDIEDLK